MVTLRLRAAPLVLVAMLAAFSLSSCAAVEVAGASTGATVEVDVFSGRENPTVPLSDEASDALLELIDEQLPSAVAAQSPDMPLGFRGLIVVPDADADDDGWREARVTPDAVVLTTGAGTLLISDGDGSAFDIIWSDIRGQLEPAVVTAVEDAV